VSPGYAITGHKSQGSEFPAIVIPLATRLYLLLQRSQVYTGITRGMKLVVLIGQKKGNGDGGEAMDLSCADLNLTSGNQSKTASRQTAHR